MAVLCGVFLLGAIGSGLNLITIPWLKFDSQVQMNRDIVNKTYTADNAIYNYHWFQERAGAIRALSVKIKIAGEQVKDFDTTAGPRDKWTFEDKTESARLHSVEQGLRSQYEDITQEYNARAGEADRTMFKDDLPLFFGLNPF